MDDDNDDKKPAAVPSSSTAPLPVVAENSSNARPGKRKKTDSMNYADADDDDDGDDYAAADVVAVASSTHTSAAAEPNQIAKLLQCIDRGQLESIISSSIQTQTAVTMDNLFQALPANKQWMIKASASSAPPTNIKGPSRVGTGRFDALDDSIVKNILLALPLPDRVRCVTKVCKAWRDFKMFPGLFDDLTAISCHSSKRTWRDEPYDFPGQWILDLLRWVPSPQDIRAIVIPSTPACHANISKRILKKIDELKTTHKQTAAPLAKLILSGPKITPAIFNSLRKSTLIGPGLKSFTIASSVKESKMAELVPGLLEKCPNLSEVKLPPGVIHMNRGLYHCLISRLVRARGNNPTLLQILDISCHWDGYGNAQHYLSIEMLSNLGQTCPELQVLKTSKVTGLPLVPFPKKDPGPQSSTVQNSDVSGATFLAQPMHPLPRLKTFHVRKLHKDEMYVASDSVQHFLPWLFLGMPALQDFSMGGGYYFLSKKRQKEVCYPPYPSIGQDALMALPPSIKRLQISFLTVEPSDLAALKAPEGRIFADLEHLELDHCGPRMLDAVMELNTSYPRLMVSARSGAGDGQVSFLFDSAHTAPMRTAAAPLQYSAVRLSSMVNAGFAPANEPDTVVSLSF